MSTSDRNPQSSPGRTILTTATKTARAVLAAASAIAATKKAAAATLATGAATTTASLLTGADPYPWILGAIGGLIVIVKFPAATRTAGVANAIISVLLAGLGCDLLSALLAKHAGIEVSRYLSALALAILWPLSIPVAQSFWPALKDRMAKKIGGNP